MTDCSWPYSATRSNISYWQIVAICSAAFVTNPHGYDQNIFDFWSAFTETGGQVDRSTHAAVTAAQELLLIPLSKLRHSSRNVRKNGGMSIPELAASIARVGLLQNLNVVLAADGERYEVVAGRRSLPALSLLVKRRKLAKDFEVACLLGSDATARTVSLIENVRREAMHLADQFEAFADLVAEGRPIEDIERSVLPHRCGQLGYRRGAGFFIRDLTVPSAAPSFQ